MESRCGGCFKFNYKVFMVSSPQKPCEKSRGPFKRMFYGSEGRLVWVAAGKDEWPRCDGEVGGDPLVLSKVEVTILTDVLAGTTSVKCRVS